MLLIIKSEQRFIFLSIFNFSNYLLALELYLTMFIETTC